MNNQVRRPSVPVLRFLGATGTVTDTVGSATGKVTETVKGATGGAVDPAPVGKAVDETVKGVVGPDSPIGKAVDETVKGVGGLLDGDR